MKITHEKRKYPRHAATKTVKVFDLNTEEYLGNLVNISPGGIMLVTHLNIQANSVYQLRIALPEAHGNQEPIAFGAEVLWTEDSMDPNKKWAGIQIIDISKSTVIRIIDLIDDYLLPGGANPSEFPIAAIT